MRDKALKIIDHYGVNHQLRKLQEEVFEFNEAVLDIEHVLKLPYSKYINHIEEELADVLVLLLQIKEHYQIFDDDVIDVMNRKIDRQLKRIEEEKDK